MPRNYISLNNCKDGYLYKIKARNSQLGIFSKKDSGFIISRKKFTYNYLFIEYHWDLGYEGFGTVKPLEELEKVKHMNKKEMLDFLNKKLKELDLIY